jgi:hypothetical protein
VITDVPASRETIESAVNQRATTHNSNNRHIRHAERLVELAAPTAGMHILDAATGTGSGRKPIPFTPASRPDDATPTEPRVPDAIAPPTKPSHSSTAMSAVVFDSAARFLQ